MVRSDGGPHVVKRLDEHDAGSRQGWEVEYVRNFTDVDDKIIKRAGEEGVDFRELTERNIGTSVHFIPVHTHPWYARRYDLAPDAFPVAWDAYSRMLSLPLHPGLTDDDVDDVIDAVLDTARAFRR